MAKPGDVIENPVIGDRIVFRRTRKETNGELLEFDLYAQPSAMGPPVHVHPHSEEHFEVLKGQIRLEMNGQEMSLSEGAAFTVPAGVPHRWWNDGEAEAVVRVRVQPEAGMESFLETLYGLAKDGKTNARGLPNLFQLAVTASAYYDASYVTKPPLVVQKILFGILAPIARLLGYRADYPYPYDKQAATHGGSRSRSSGVKKVFCLQRQTSVLSKQPQFGRACIFRQICSNKRGDTVMKGIVLKGFGGLDMLDERELPVPEPGPYEVIVKNLALSVNPVSRSEQPASGRA